MGEHRRRVLVTAGMLAALAPNVGFAQPKAPAADPLKGLAKDHDKMKGISWYRSPTSPKHANANAFYLYFGREDSGRFTALRLVIQYYADDWLFVRRAWAKVDGQTIDPLPQRSGRPFGWERDNNGGKIWEWSDAEVSQPADRAAVRKIAEAKSVTVRFEGQQYHTDRTLTAAQLKAMRDVIAAYEAATGAPWR